MAMPEFVYINDPSCREEVAINVNHIVSIVHYKGAKRVEITTSTGSVFAHLPAGVKDGEVIEDMAAETVGEFARFVSDLRVNWADEDSPYTNRVDAYLYRGDDEICVDVSGDISTYEQN